MLELQLKPSELSVFEKCTKSRYSLSVKKQVQQIIKASYTTYFSSFKILHQLIKSFVIATHNRVFSQLKSHFLKDDLNSLKNLKIDPLQTIQTIIYIRKLQCISLLRIVHTDITFFVGTGLPRTLVQNIANGKVKESSKYVINDICYNILSNGLLKYSTGKRFEVNGLEEL